jgi:two-component system, sensor histidine kinase and response regulator
LLKAIRPLVASQAGQSGGMLITPDSLAEGADTPPPASPAFDEKALLEHFGGDRDLLGELAKIFLMDCPARLSAIQAGVERSDAAVLLEAAHALRGSVANFGAAQAVDAALKLELMGKAGDLTGAAAALVRLQAAMAALIADLGTVTGQSAQ